MKQFSCGIICLLLVMSTTHTYGYGEKFLNCCNLDMPVVFEDQKLSPGAKEAIIQDYQLIFGHLEAGDKRWKVRKPREVEINDREFLVSEGVIFKEDGCKIEPDGYEDEFILIAEDKATQTEYIFVSKKLSDAYRESLELRAENTEAFDKLDEFISFMNNLEEEVEKKNITDPREFINFRQESKLPSNVFTAEGVEMYVQTYKDVTIKKFSLLELMRGRDYLRCREKSRRKKIAEATEGLNKAIYYTEVLIIKTENGKQNLIKQGIAYFKSSKWKMLW